MTPRKILTAALISAFLVAAVLPAAGGRPNGSWRLDPVWDDGKAELSVYEARWPRYGYRFPGRVLLVLVKEPWAPDLEVKADTPRPDGFEVIKLNLMRDVPTGIYTYHQMASVYLRRDDGTVRKVVATSSEACGVSWAELARGQLLTSSYFDGQGRRSTVYPPGALPEDGLAAILRDYVAGDPPAELELFPSLLAGAFPPLEASRYSVEKSSVGALSVPAGRFADAVELTLDKAGHRLSLIFEGTVPHRLLRFEASDGTIYELAKSERLSYWRLNAPGDEAWLPENLR